MGQGSFSQMVYELIASNIVKIYVAITWIKMTQLGYKFAHELP